MEQHPVQNSKIQSDSITNEKPVAHVDPQVHKLPNIVIYGGIAILMIILACIALFVVFRPNKEIVTVKPTPTITTTPTPTPRRIPSALASESAFMTFDQSVIRLSENLSRFIVDDPSLSPPSIELDLGFDQ